MAYSYISSIGIADDHWHFRKALKLALESFGYNVIIEAENGQELIDKIIRGSVPDICVLDMNMPFLNGVQTTLKLKERWPFIPIVICSMNDSAHVREEALNAGANAYILKYELIERLRDVLRDLVNLQ